MAIADRSSWSLYNLLQAQPDASTDEIKTAFKRRALEVHPDKGGSKEAFHRVYQAFVTLFDPKSRQAYDEQLRGTKRPRAGTTRTSSTQAKPAKCKQNTDVKQTAVKNATRLMMKIHELLQQVPRGVRLEVISKEFSQKQRVLLQKWMTDQKEEEAARCPTSSSCTSESKVVPRGDAKPKQTELKGSCRTKGSKSKKSNSGLRGVASVGASGYKALARIERVEIYTLCIDLPTALEHFAILLSAKQKIQGCEGLFEERLKQALESSAAEQGKRLEDLEVRFRVDLPKPGMLIGDHQVRSPVVRTFGILGRIRALINKSSFRAGFWLPGRSISNMYAYFSPQELQDRWEELQKMVAEMFHVAGSDGHANLCQVHSWYEAHEPFRQKRLRQWERESMAKQDKGKHVPKDFLTRWANRRR
eukprot:Skav234043  [mRNA]  locus=scaffold461:156231:157481:- [translate_table: standard]